MSRNCCLLSLVVACVQAGGAMATPLFPAPPAPTPLPWHDMSARAVPLARPLIEKATLAAQGPVEHFYGSPEHYYYFLDHPEQAVTQWRKLGAKCCAIAPLGEGRFRWGDDNGSEVVWETVHRGPGVRVWYAVGKVRPGPLLPLVPVKALLVLHHTESRAKDGRCVLRHQADIYLQTDSKTTTALTKLMGTSAHKMAEQGLSQFQLFFAGLSWYASKHPEQAPAMLRPAAVPSQSAQVLSRPPARFR